MSVDGNWIIERWCENCLCTRKHELIIHMMLVDQKRKQLTYTLDPFLECSECGKKAKVSRG